MKLALLILVVWFGAGCEEQAVREPLVVSHRTEASVPRLASDLAASPSEAVIERESLQASESISTEQATTPFGKLSVAVMRKGLNRKGPGADLALRMRLLIRVPKPNGWYRTARFFDYLSGPYRTDAEGRLVVDLALPAGSELSEYPGAVAAVEVEIHEPGFQRISKIARFSLGVEPSAELALDAKTGGSLRGSTVDANGEPVVHAKVRLFDERDYSCGLARSDEQGDFVIHFHRAQTVDLAASSEMHGTARINGIALDPTQEPEAIVLRLESGATLGGVVRDPEGSPIADLPLFCARFGVEVERRNYYSSLRGELLTGKLLQSGGSVGALATTDAEGQFVFPGLAAGEYEIFAAPASSTDYDRLLTKRPVLGGSKNLELVVTTYRTVVRIFSADGIAQPFAHNDSRGGTKAGASWKQLDVLRVTCSRSDGQGHAGARIQEQCWMQGQDDSVRTLALEANQHYLFNVWHPKHEMIEHEFFVEEGVAQSTIDLQLSSPTEPGLIRVNLALPPGAERVVGANVHLYSGRSGTSLAWTRMDALEFDLKCAPGFYGLEFHPAGVLDWGGCRVTMDDDGFDKQSAYLADLPGTLQVGATARAGQVVSVLRALEGRGRIKVDLASLTLESNPKVHFAIRRQRASEWKSLNFYRLGALFVSPKGAVIAGRDPDGDDNWIRPGMNRRASDSLELGSWVLRARCPETEDFFAEFEIESGKLTTVPIELVPREHGAPDSDR